MRVLPLVLAVALLSPSAALAQSTAQQMLDTARKARATADTPGLSADDRAQIIHDAEEIEQAVRDGVYGALDAPAAKPQLDLAGRIMAEHDGRLDWLRTKIACAGYTQENYLTYRYATPLTARDNDCRTAYGHWATFDRTLRYGHGQAAAEEALARYDAAAKRAVELYGDR